MTDKHYTSPELATAIIDRLVKYGDLVGKDRVLDPCVGKGAFANAVRAATPNATVVTVDEDESVEADVHGDFLTSQLDGEFDLITSNVPFSLAQQFVEKAVSLVKPRGSVAFLLLLQFLGSAKRKEFFERFPVSSVDVIRPRPSFSDDGQTDMREYALFRWIPEDFDCMRRTSMCRLGYIDCERPKKVRVA